MSIDTTRYCLSFVPGSFSPDDLVKLVQRDLGFSKDQVVPSSSGFSIGEGESFGGRRFSFMILENDTAQDNIFWVLKGQEPPPREVFNELLSHPGFVFAYAEDEEDYYRFYQSWPGYTPISTSDDPDHATIVRHARLAIGWKIWFGKESQSWFSRDILLSFKQAYKIAELPNGVIEVQLFEQPKDAFRDESLRKIQRAFRNHIDMDKVIKELESQRKS